MFCYADQDDIRSLLFLKRMKFLFRWVFLILSLSYLINTPFATQVPFYPIRIATAGSSWTRIFRRPALGISSATFKTFANKAVQVGIKSRMREYGYNTAVEIALDVAGQIRFIQEACQEVAANSGLLVAQSTLQNEFCPVYHPQFFRLQPSSISVTLVLTNYPSPASIPACPAVFRLAHSSQSLPHNHTRPTVSRTVAHPCRLLPFRFGLSFPSRPASSIHRSSPCIKSTATPPQFHSIIWTSTIRDERHHVPITIFPRSLILRVRARLVIDHPARDLGMPSSTIGVRSRELRHASSPNDATTTPFDRVLVVNPKFSESIRIPLNTPVMSPSREENASPLFPFSLPS